MRFRKQNAPAFRSPDPAGGGTPAASDGAEGGLPPRAGRAAEPAPTAAGSSPAGPRAPQRPVRPVRRFFRRLAFFLIIILLLIGGILAFYPWSSPVLDQRLQEAWLNATGMPLTYRQATVRLLRGLVVVDRPTVLDPQTNQPVAGLDEVRIHIPVGQFFFSRPPYAIKSVKLFGRVAVEVIQRPDGVALGAPWDRLLTQAKEEHALHKKRERRPVLALRHLEAGSLDVRWIDARGEQPRELARLNSVHFSGDFDKELKPEALLLTGQLNPIANGDVAAMRNAPDALRIQLKGNPWKGTAKYWLDLQHFNSRQDLPWTLPVGIRTGGLTVRGQVARPADGRWQVSGDSKLADINLIGNDAMHDQALGDTTLNWRLGVDPAAGSLTVERLSLAGKLATMESSGTLGLRAPHPYTWSFQPLHVTGATLALIAAELGRAGEVVRPAETTLHLAAELHGTLAEKTPAAVIGRLSLAGLNLRPADLPPMNGLRAEATLTTRTLEVSQASAIVQGIPVAFRGLLHGHLLGGQIQSADVNWQSAGDLANVAAILGEQLGRRAQGLNLSGKVQGQGVLRVDEPLSGTLTSALERTHMEGNLAFSEMNVNLSGLPEPVRNVRGQVSFTTQAARLQGGAGEFLGSKFDLNGELSGASAFWVKPHLQLESKAVLEVKELLAQLPRLSPQLKQSADRLPTAKGRADLRLTVAADIAQWRQARVQGQLDLQGLDVNHPRLPEPLRDVKGRVDFTPKTARLKDVTATFMDEKIALGGEVSGAPHIWNKPRLDLDGHANLNLDDLLQQAGKLAPGLRENLAKLPPMEGRAGLTLGLKAEAGQWEQARYDGELELTDFRTEVPGAESPLPLSLSRARLAFDTTRVTIQEAKGRWGELGLGVTGAVQTDRAALDVTLNGPLQSFKQQIPKALERFRVDGAAEARASLTVEPRQGTRPPSTWVDWRDWWQKNRPEPGALRPWVARHWWIDGQGTIRLDDAELTFITMPAQLAHISGPLRFDTEHLWSPQPLPVQDGAGSSGLVGMIDLVYGTTINDWIENRPIGNPRFNYRVTGDYLKMDGWLKPWNVEALHRLQGPPKPGEEKNEAFDPNLKPSFAMHGEFDTRRASYHGIQMVGFKAVEDHFLYHDQYSWMRWHHMGANVYGGLVQAEVERKNRGWHITANANNIDFRELAQAYYGKEHVGGIYSGRLTLQLTMDRAYGDPPPPFQGMGNFRIEESRFVSNKIFNSLGGLLKLPFFNELTFSTIEGPFNIMDKKVSTSGVTFVGPLMNLNLSGSYGPAKRLDMQLKLHFLEKFIGGVPLVGDVLNLFNRMAGKVLQFRIMGTTENPVVLPL